MRLELCKSGARFPGLDILLQVMQQQSPVGVALAVITVGSRPPCMGQFDQSPAWLGLGEFNGHVRADGIPRTFDALPYNPFWRGRLGHFPTERRSLSKLETPSMAGYLILRRAPNTNL